MPEAPGGSRRRTKMSAMRKGMGASTLTGFPEGLFSGASGFSPLHNSQKRRLAPGLKFANSPITNF